MREEVWVSSPASNPFRGRLLPTLLPSRWTPPGSGGQLWDVGPGRRAEPAAEDMFPWEGSGLS